MNLTTIQANIESQLTALTGVTVWDSIQFNLLPDDDPIGYLQLSQASLGPVTELTYLVGIGFASTTLSGLWAQSNSLIETIRSNLVLNNVCVGEGRAMLDGPIEVEIPNTYVNQGEFSATDGYSVAVSFVIKVQL
jgi:hypothetical protein